MEITWWWQWEPSHFWGCLHHNCPQKNSSELISSLPKTRAIRAISFWDALQMHSYKANSTCFVPGISRGASLILALKKLCNTRVAKNSFTVTVNSFKESNLQKSATVKPVKECTRQKLLDIIWPRFLKTLVLFSKTNPIHGFMDGRKAGKAATRRTLAVAASRGVSLRHAEDAPLVFFIISFSPGHQRVQNESQAMYYIPILYIFGWSWTSIMTIQVSESKSVENIEAEKSLR